MRRSFKDRGQAGEELGRRLLPYKHLDPLVVALPRGGAPVAFEVAKALDAPLDVLVVRKIGAPGRPELGIGAVGEGGTSVVDEELLTRLGLTRAEVSPLVEAAEHDMEEGLRAYRGDRPPLDVADRLVIVVDDGIATGGTMRAALQVLRKRGAARTIVAVPVAGPEALERLADDADEIVCLEVSPMLFAVGLAYEEFEQVGTDTVRAIVMAASRHRSEWAPGSAPSREVSIQADGVNLEGDLTVPKRAFGLVIFAHGSGSSRTSHRNRQVARHLQEAGIATLLFNLLSQEEARVDGVTAQHRYDVNLLAKRMIGTIDWCLRQPLVSRLPKACYGASTGAAAALAAAAERPAEVVAVVSRGGRPDLAHLWLPKVSAPCLLIVGEKDLPVLEIHADTIDRIKGPTHLVIVPGAGHLFEEAGAIDEVGRATTEFLRNRLRPPAEARP